MRVSDGRGVGVVEIGVGGQPESIAGRGAELHRLRDAQAAGEIGAPDGTGTAAQNLFAETGGESPAAGGMQVEIEIARTLIARMRAQVVAVNSIAVEFKAVEERSSLADGFAPAQNRLPALVDVIVGVVSGICAQQDEVVGVTAIAKGSLGVSANLLARRGEPALGALPRVIRPIELISPKGAVA